MCSTARERTPFARFAARFAGLVGGHVKPRPCEDHRGPERGLTLPGREGRPGIIECAEFVDMVMD